MALVFVGFMGAGKSSALDDVLDTDALLEDQLEMSIASFFAAYGERRFRQREEPVVLRALRSVDIATHAPAEALRERTDSATIPAAGVVGEAMVAIVLAGAYREKFGGDHIDDALGALGAYRERIGWRR